MRSYLAQRILRQHGFESLSNLSGGYQLWNSCSEEMALLVKNEIEQVELV